MYDLCNLNSKQKNIYNDFLLNICSGKILKLTYNEDNLRNLFEQELNKLLRDLNFIDTGYEFFRHETSMQKGRNDFQYGNTIIEYKKYGLLSSEKECKEGINQIKNYILEPRFKGYKIFGFLFDGTKIYICEKDETDKIISYKEECENLKPDNVDKFIKTIFGSGIQTISPDNLKIDFGIIDKNDNIIQNSDVISLVRYFFHLLNNKHNKRTDLLFKEWEKLFRLAENDNGKHQDIKDRRKAFSEIFDEEIDGINEYKALFALHTTLSLIIKLLIVRIINDMKENRFKDDLDKYYKNIDIKIIKNFFEKIEDGQFFIRIGIINLTDNDFFSWYIKETWNNTFVKFLQKIVFKICQYQDINITQNNIARDLFKSLYLKFIPKCVRHSFGEYYTPYWLAERTFLSATEKEKNYSDKSYIDPNCGSGTFLTVFLNYKHKNLKEKIDFEDYCSKIVGIDINPIAVLMAKTNIFIQSVKYCNFDISKKYEIPVYLCDSLYVPQNINIGNIECYDYELYTTGLQPLDKNSINIILPKSLVNKNNFISIIYDIEKAIIEKDREKALYIFESNCQDIKMDKILKNKIEVLINDLIKFENEKLNSIWLKIFSNYFKVATFTNFDYIIGNPAWVKWSALPEIYRENVKSKIRLDGLFSKDKNTGGNSLNICALIANKCCERWLGSNSRFSFIMPRAILFNKSFEGFRNLIINKNEQLYFDEILDFSKSGEIFDGVGLDFCCYTISRVPIKFNFLNIIEYNKKTSIDLTQDLDWYGVKEYLSYTKKLALPLKNENSENNNYLIVKELEEAKRLKKFIGKCHYKFRSGAGVKYPLRLQFIEQKNEQLGIFHPYIKVGNKCKVDRHNKICLELKYIKPLITAPMLENNGVKWENDYCICLYEFGTKKPIREEELQRKAPYIKNWLEINYDILSHSSSYNKRIQNNKEYYAILRMGFYVWADNFVCIRDNTKLAPNYISFIQTHWGDKKTPIFEGHINYISEHTVGKQDFITYDEAHYILNILKNKDNQNIILNSQDKRSISGRIPIDIPLFDNHD